MNHISSKPQLNATAASLLGFLCDGPLTGWDIVTFAEQRIGTFWSLTRSQVYRELNTLADQGLIIPGERGTRAKRTFTITPKGITAFHKWISDSPLEEVIRFPLLLSVSFADHLSPQQLEDFITTHRETHIRQLYTYEKQLRQLTLDAKGQRMTLRFGINYEKMVLAWMEDILQETADEKRASK